MLEVWNSLADEPDPPGWEAIDAGSVEAAVAEFEGILNRRESEAVLHEFLSSHTYFFNSALRLDGISPVYSKVKLGCDYEVDFAWFDSSSFGPEWRLVEIESPTARLYTKGGNPTATLTHAIQQLRDWHGWVHENLAYSRKLMPGIEYPLCLLFMGRRSELTPATKAKLRRYRFDHRHMLRLHTLDWFAGAARSTIGLLRNGAGSLPTKALSHRDLAAGLPNRAQQWIAYHAPYVADPSMQEARQDDREARALRHSKIDDG